jgi:peptide/nickel transport system permease protein
MHSALQGRAATLERGIVIAEKRRPKHGVRGFIHRLRQTRLATSALVVIALLIVAAIFAPLLAPYNPERTDFTAALASPSWSHWLGTDNLGRDILSRIIFGARISVQVGIIAVGISVAIGVPIGLLVGYTRNGLLDTAVMRCIDALLAFPTLVLALAISAVLGPSLRNVMIAVGVVGVPSYARLIRGQVLAIKQNEYIEAARAIGLTDVRILARYVLPNVTAPLIVQASIGVAFAIMSEASLSFLGLGVQPPTPSWGGMLSIGKDYLQLAWWMSLAPGFAIFITVLAVNFLGDGIRDALDPSLRHRQ